MINGKPVKLNKYDTYGILLGILSVALFVGMIAFMASEDLPPEPPELPRW